MEHHLKTGKELLDKMSVLGMISLKVRGSLAICFEYVVMHVVTHYVHIVFFCIYNP